MTQLWDAGSGRVSRQRGGPNWRGFASKALYNRSRDDAQALGKTLGVDAIYDNAKELVSAAYDSAGKNAVVHM